MILQYLKKIVLFLWSVLLSTALFAQHTAVDSLFAQARETDSLELKIDLYSQIISIDSLDFNAFFERGQIYGQLWGKSSNRDVKLQAQAMQDFNKVIMLNPAHHPSYFFLAFIHEKTEEMDLTVQAISNAISLDIRNPAYYRKRGLLYTEQGQYNLAKTDLSLALKLFKRAYGSRLDSRLEAGLYNGRAFCSFQLKDYKEAMKDVKKALQIDDSDYLAHLRKGNIYAIQGNYKKALKAYNFIISRSEIFLPAYLQRGKVYYALGEIEKAMADWQKVINEGLDFDISKENVQPGSGTF